MSEPHRDSVDPPEPEPMTWFQRCRRVAVPLAILVVLAVAFLGFILPQLADDAAEESAQVDANTESIIDAEKLAENVSDEAERRLTKVACSLIGDAPAPSVELNLSTCLSYLAGDQGIPGVQGDTGIGTPGLPGTEGARGLPGAVGESITGSAGGVGEVGPRGESVTGPTGATGPEGAAGESIVGPAGESVTGPKGDPGETVVGPQGPPGNDSTVPGPAGPEGPPGAAGVCNPATINTLDGPVDVCVPP